MKKLIILIITILLLCGCEDNRCTESHEEKGVCSIMRCLPNGGTLHCFPIAEPCTKTICDKYED